VDHRDETQIEHSVESLIKQRVMGLALGYEEYVVSENMLGSA
jgi:hypothetical protein